MVHGTASDFHCAAWTAAGGFDPIGSQPRADRFVVVEVPLPWPADAESLPWLAEVDAPAGTRLQAVVPDTAPADGAVTITRWERVGATFAGLDWCVPATVVPAVLDAVVRGILPEGIDGVDAAGTPSPDEVLVCAHGSRDRCCGGPGTRLTVEARAALPGVRIRRTSHLGGHRFAPTACTFPDGRGWAFLDVDALVGIVERTIPSAEAREFYRGNAALDPWAQIVEAELLAAQGWSAVDVDRLSADVDVDELGERAEVVVHVESGGATDSHRRTVAVARRYPVLVCGRPPEDATKSAAEYRIA